jgi:aerobic carbon-monoxide dehydrogenase small subunit
MKSVSITVNGRKIAAPVEVRTSLADFLRNDQLLTGTHLGCEHGVCGACTVLVDGEPVRSCLMLAVAADGSSVKTIEGFKNDHIGSVICDCFSECHGVQCGFCTPGMLATAYDVVTRIPNADRERIKLEFSGNLCRCTGYLGIIDAVEMAMARLKEMMEGGATNIGSQGSRSTN